MSLRGYQHKTPMDGPRSGVHLARYIDQLNRDCFGAPNHWFQQDIADLYRKWEAEARWLTPILQRGAMLLRIEHGQTVRTGLFRAPRRDLDDEPLKAVWRQIADQHPHRDWSKKDKRRLAELLASLDPTAKEPSVSNTNGQEPDVIPCPFPGCPTIGKRSGVKNHYRKNHGVGADFERVWGHKPGMTKLERQMRHLEKQGGLS